MWKNNNVAYFLKQLGYSYIDLQTVSEKQKKYFSWSYIKRELQTFLSDYYCMGHVFIDSWTPLYSILANFYHKTFRTHILKKLESLKKSTQIKSPKFVYAHFINPHMPHVFDRNGNPLNIDDSLPELEKNIYGHIEALQHINKRIIECIDVILKQSSTPPTIILQGDHGAVITPINSANRYKILNAWHWPDGQGNLYQTMSPVNNFRLIFNHYFAMNLPLLKDESLYGPLGDGSFKKMN